MNSDVESIIRDAAGLSARGSAPFAQVAGMLIQAGVESYAVDFRARRTTYFLPDGEALDIPLEVPAVATGDAFDAEALRSAIRGAQQGVVKYPEFKRLSRQAGCVGYVAWLAGRHVAYFGRRGETHVEHFPPAPANADGIDSRHDPT